MALVRRDLGARRGGRAYLVLSLLEGEAEGGGEADGRAAGGSPLGGRFINRVRTYALM